MLKARSYGLDIFPKNLLAINFRIRKDYTFCYARKYLLSVKLANYGKLTLFLNVDQQQSQQIWKERQP
jgi:hypothetical protein